VEEAVMARRLRMPVRYSAAGRRIWRRLVGGLPGSWPGALRLPMTLVLATVATIAIAGTWLLIALRAVLGLVAGGPSLSTSNCYSPPASARPTDDH
jgi:hypothetical protein